MKVTGQQIIDLLKTRVGDKYVLGAFAPKDKKDYHGPWDCAEIQAWAIYQLTNKLYGCLKNDGPAAKADAYTGYFYRDAKKLGKIIPVDQAKRTPGALLLRISGDGGISHIVASQGDGKTVEAHSTKTGVITSTVDGRRWDIGILVPWIEYNEKQNILPVANPVGVIYRFRTPIMVLPKIGEIQHKLKDLGYYNQKVDNVYGKGTYEAVRAYQNAIGLNPDGEVGPKTLSSLNL